MLASAASNEYGYAPLAKQSISLDFQGRIPVEAA
jgi:hypothetical protein